MKTKKLILFVSLLLCTALILCSCFKISVGKNDPTDEPGTRATETTPEQTTPEETTTPEPTTPEVTTTAEELYSGDYTAFAIYYMGYYLDPASFDLESSITLNASNGKGYFNANDGLARSREPMVSSDQRAPIAQDYLDRITAIVKNKFTVSTEILYTDYYSHVFSNE